MLPINCLPRSALPVLLREEPQTARTGDAVCSGRDPGGGRVGGSGRPWRRSPRLRWHPRAVGPGPCPASALARLSIEGRAVRDSFPRGRPCQPQESHCAWASPEQRRPESGRSPWDCRAGSTHPCATGNSGSGGDPAVGARGAGPRGCAQSSGTRVYEAPCAGEPRAAAWGFGQSVFEKLRLSGTPWAWPHFPQR